MKKHITFFIILLSLIVVGVVLGLVTTHTDSTIQKPNESLVITVEHELVDCVGVAPQQCMIVDGEYWYDDINGFEYEEGYTYELSVQRIDRTEPIPADTGSWYYQLDEIISKTPFVSFTDGQGHGPDAGTEESARSVAWQLVRSQDIYVQGGYDLEMELLESGPTCTSIDCPEYTFAYSFKHDEGPEASYSGIVEVRNDIPTLQQEDNFVFILSENSWVWSQTTKPDGSVVTPQDPEAFTLTFTKEGVQGTTDCNNFFGQFETMDSEITIGPLAQTRMYCEGSQESEFVSSFSQAVAYTLEEEVLIFELFDGEIMNGTMEFYALPRN